MKKGNLIQDILDKVLTISQKGERFSEDAFRSELEQEHPNENEEINASMRLNDLFVTIRSGEDGSDINPELQELNKKLDFIETSNSSLIQKRNFGKRLLKVAAVILPLAIIGSASLFLLKKEPINQQQVISTLKGSKTKIILEDGTTVWLNAESELKYPSTFNGKDKRIINLSGEAFFDVAHNEKKPFEVYVKGYKVKVLGTKFNVKAYPNDEKIEATLEKGRVDVEKLGSLNTNRAQQIVSLKPKQTIVLYNDGRAAAKEDKIKKPESIILKKTEKIKKEAILIESIDLEPYISWKENKLVFWSKPLKEIVLDLERWYNIDINIVDEKLNDITCTATFTTETAEQAIHALCMASKIKYEFEKNKVVLKAN